MKMIIALAITLMGLSLEAARAEKTKNGKPAKNPCIVTAADSVAHWMPAGLARANDARQVAALYSQQNAERVKNIRQKYSDQLGQLNAQEEYHRKLIAYRTRLVDAQRERKLRQVELELEREAKANAKMATERMNWQRHRESIYLQHHSVHAHQRKLNDKFWREQRLRQIIRQEITSCETSASASCPCTIGEGSKSRTRP